MRVLTLAFSCLAVTACTTLQQPAGDTAADTVLRGGKIITVDKDFSIRQAIAIVKDRIVAVGSDAEIARYVGTSTRVVDLGGRAVITGLSGSHLRSGGG